jgi:hypothetical protein
VKIDDPCFNVREGAKYSLNLVRGKAGFAVKYLVIISSTGCTELGAVAFSNVVSDSYKWGIWVCSRVVLV